MSNELELFNKLTKDRYNPQAQQLKNKEDAEKRNLVPRILEKTNLYLKEEKTALVHLARQIVRSNNYTNFDFPVRQRHKFDRDDLILVKIFSRASLNEVKLVMSEWEKRQKRRE